MASREHAILDTFAQWGAKLKSWRDETLSERERERDEKSRRDRGGTEKTHRRQRGKKGGRDAINMHDIATPSLSFFSALPPDSVLPSSLSTCPP